jgi:hypothetical protein
MRTDNQKSIDDKIIQSLLSVGWVFDEDGKILFSIKHTHFNTSNFWIASAEGNESTFGLYFAGVNHKEPYATGNSLYNLMMQTFGFVRVYEFCGLTKEQMALCLEQELYTEGLLGNIIVDRDGPTSIGMYYNSLSKKELIEEYPELANEKITLQELWQLGWYEITQYTYDCRTDNAILLYGRPMRKYDKKKSML